MMFLIGGVLIAQFKPQSMPGVLAVYASPIQASCYQPKPYQCRIHVEPFTINIASGTRLAQFQLTATRISTGVQTTIYDFRPDQSNPVPYSGTVYTPSQVAKDFAATCGQTYTVGLLGKDTGDINMFSLGTTGQFTCPAVFGGDTVGVFRPTNGKLFLRNTNSTGIANIAISYGLPGDYPIVGDWDGNGTATIGIYRNGKFYLRNSNTLGIADIVITFGTPGDQPVAGDWNGDGIDTIGVYHSSTGQFKLRNTNSTGAADMTFTLGSPGDVGIAGDWNGDGLDTTGVFRPSNGRLFLKNANTTGIADIMLTYGLPGDKPITGDWDNDGVDTIGVYRGNKFFLRNSNTNGFADITLDLGVAADMPITGNWNGIP